MYSWTNFEISIVGWCTPVTFDVAFIDFVMPHQDGVTTLHMFKVGQAGMRYRRVDPLESICNENVIKRQSTKI